MRHLFVSLAVVAILLLAACSTGGDQPLAVTPTTTQTEVATPAPTSAVSTRPPVADVEYKTHYPWQVPTQDKPGSLNLPAKGGPQPVLVEIEAAPHLGFDRIVFRFKHGMPPNCDFYYSPKPSQPGSGYPIKFPDDVNAYITISFAAIAHDDSGDSTVRKNEFKRGLTTLASQHVVHFEGVWAFLGLRVAPNSDDLRPVQVAAESDHTAKIYSLVFDIQAPV